ncbi:unnamed protein product, partial [Sphacelaria rigidula]
ASRWVPCAYAAMLQRHPTRILLMPLRAMHRCKPQHIIMCVFARSCFQPLHLLPLFGISPSCTLNSLVSRDQRILVERTGSALQHSFNFREISTAGQVVSSAAMEVKCFEDKKRAGLYLLRIKPPIVLLYS